MARSSPGSLRLFTAFGIDVFVHWSWFVIAAFHYDFAVRRHIFQNSYWFLGVYFSLFAIVVLHEFGHALACRSVGGQANTIVLWPLGGIAFVRPPQRPGPMLWSIAAGPLVNVALVPVTAALYAVTVGFTQDASCTDLQRYVVSITMINGVLLVFNLLPIYPLDGGQIVQSILWFFVGRARSLWIAASFGLGSAVVIGVLLLLYRRDTWLILMVLFLGWQAWNGLRMARTLVAMEAAGFDPSHR